MKKCMTICMEYLEFLLPTFLCNKPHKLCWPYLACSSGDWQAKIGLLATFRLLVEICTLGISSNTFTYIVLLMGVMYLSFCQPWMHYHPLEGKWIGKVWCKLTSEAEIDDAVNCITLFLTLSKDCLSLSADFLEVKKYTLVCLELNSGTVIQKTVLLVFIVTFLLSSSCNR